jgi:hypothetical protein
MRQVIAASRVMEGLAEDTHICRGDGLVIESLCAEEISDVVSKMARFSVFGRNLADFVI